MKLDLGSGGRRLHGYTTLDKDPKTNAHITHDIETPLPFPDNHFDEVRAHHILEHVHTEKKTLVMYEIWRVLKPGGIADIELPCYPHPQAVMDPTHLSLWHRYSFWYYEAGNRFRDAFASRSTEPVPQFAVTEESQDDWLLKLKLKAVK